MSSSPTTKRSSVNSHAQFGYSMAQLKATRFSPVRPHPQRQSEASSQ
jgi:hypothetical protein